MLYNGLLQIHAWSVMHTWYRCSARTIARDPRFTARRNRVALFSLLWKAAANSPDLRNFRTPRIRLLELHSIRNYDHKRHNVWQVSSEDSIKDGIARSRAVAGKSGQGSTQEHVKR